MFSKSSVWDKVLELPLLLDYLPTQCKIQCRIKGGARGAAAPGPAVLGAAIGGSGNFLCCITDGGGTLFRYVTNHPGRFSLLPSVGRKASISQSAVMRCGWGVKADMV